MQKAQCDYFVKIRQVGNGTASLNVATATAIVLHTFVEWAGFKENEREAGRDKYIVTAPDLNTLSEAALDKRFQRQLNREIENTTSVDRDT
jgi:hypothetical protein